MDPDTSSQWYSFLRSNLLVILFGFLGFLFIGIGLVQYFGEKESEIIFEKNKEEDVKEIVVDVSGAVINPGVYSLPQNSRLQDAVIAAGGLDVDADRAYISQNVNMARILTDGEKIYFYFRGENRENTANIFGEIDNSLININTASVAELDTLPGVGPVTIEKILDGRPYSAIEDLLDHDVVGNAVFEKIRDLIAV